MYLKLLDISLTSDISSTIFRLMFLSLAGDCHGFSVLGFHKSEMRHLRVKQHGNFCKVLQFKYLVWSILCVVLMSLYLISVVVWRTVLVVQRLIGYMEPSASLYSGISPQIICLIILHLHKIDSLLRPKGPALTE